MIEIINGVRHERELTAEELAEMAVETAEAERQYWDRIPYDEAVNLEIRKRYSVSQEFAILRQRDEKPAEYAEYYEFCERCKAYIKAKKGVTT